MRFLQRSKSGMQMFSLIKFKRTFLAFLDRLLDRIDIQVEVPAVKYAELSADVTGEPSATVVRERVEAARRITTSTF